MSRKVNTIKISNELLERGDHISIFGSTRYIRSDDERSLFYNKHLSGGIMLKVLIISGYNSRLILER